MEKTGKDLKLGDTLYYVDHNFIIKEYTIEGMELTIGSAEGAFNHPPIKELWNGINISFGNQWEKKPTILKDSKGGRNRWNGFDIFIYKEDAIDRLNELIDKEIKNHDYQISQLKNKKISKRS